jgi:hypothetical protein
LKTESGRSPTVSPDERIALFTGQSLLIFIQLIWSSEAAAKLEQANKL